MILRARMHVRTIYSYLYLLMHIRQFTKCKMIDKIFSEHPSIQQTAQKSKWLLSTLKSHSLCFIVVFILRYRYEFTRWYSDVNFLRVAAAELHALSESLMIRGPLKLFEKYTSCWTIFDTNDVVSAVCDFKITGGSLKESYQPTL